MLEWFTEAPLFFQSLAAGILLVLPMVIIIWVRNWLKAKQRQTEPHPIPTEDLSQFKPFEGRKQSEFRVFNADNNRRVTRGRKYRFISGRKHWS